jgi:hypothetical protein
MPKDRSLIVEAHQSKGSQSPNSSAITEQPKIPTLVTETPKEETPQIDKDMDTLQRIIVRLEGKNLIDLQQEDVSATFCIY